MKTTKIWLLIATSLVLTGCILFAGTMLMFGWDFTKLSATKYETNTYEVSDVFDRISIDTGTADIMFALSDNEKCLVECHEEEKAKYSVSVEEGVLNIKLVYERAGYFGLNIGSPKITVYLPETKYASLIIDESTGNIYIPKDFSFNNVDISLSTGDVSFNASASETIKIKASTGDICVKNISAGTLGLSVSTGRVDVSSVTCEGDITVGVSTGKAYLTDITCKNVISSGRTGDISLKNVIAEKEFYIKRTTGKVSFDGADASEIFVKTTTGKVVGSLLTDKVFIANTASGSIDVPKSASGGRCEVNTTTGNIKLVIQ